MRHVIELPDANQVPGLYVQIKRHPKRGWLKRGVSYFEVGQPEPITATEAEAMYAAILRAAGNATRPVKPKAWKR